MFQATIKSPCVFKGVGVHTGQPVTMTVRPAPVDSGIVFVRTDMPADCNVIPATIEYVTDAPMQLCTVLENRMGARVSTVEHILSALRGCGITNAIIDMDAAEAPIMDGSAQAFMESFENAGITVFTAQQDVIEILEDITVTDGDKSVSLSPSPVARFSVTIDFDHKAVGRQTFETTLVNGNYWHDLACARTFGFYDQVEYLRSIGLAQGGSLDNAVVVDKDGVMNPEGLRFEDEFARHKVLDAVGDMSLAGAPIMGFYRGVKPSHDMNCRLVRALYDRPHAWRLVRRKETAPVLSAAS